MSRFLFDVSTLIALGDSTHEFHERSHRWLSGRDPNDVILACPLVEHGFLRITSHPRYPHPLPLTDGFRFLRSLHGHPQWEGVPESKSLVDLMTEPGVMTSGQVTDTYLVLLADSQDASLVTLDTRIRPEQFGLPESVVHVIP